MPSEVTANFLHPGVIDTKLLHVNFGGGSPVADGARTSGAPGGGSPRWPPSPAHTSSIERQTRASSASGDRRLAAELWRVSAALTGLP